MLNSKFDKESEMIYRSQFSTFRYNLFLTIEKIYKKFIDNTDFRLEMIIKNIQAVKPRYILEIGSGSFPIYAFLPDFLKQTCQYFVCEINHQKAEYITQNYKNIKVACADALNLPYSDSFFDFVFSKGVLHHVDDEDLNKKTCQRINFLLESKRVLKQEGSNLLMDFCYNPKQIKGFIWHQLHKIILTEGEHNFSNELEARNLFRVTGYKNIKSEEFNTYKGLYYYVIGKK